MHISLKKNGILALSKTGGFNSHTASIKMEREKHAEITCMCTSRLHGSLTYTYTAKATESGETKAVKSATDALSLPLCSVSFLPPSLLLLTFRHNSAASLIAEVLPNSFFTNTEPRECQNGRFHPRLVPCTYRGPTSSSQWHGMICKWVESSEYQEVCLWSAEAGLR